MPVENDKSSKEELAMSWKIFPALLGVALACTLILAADGETPPAPPGQAPVPKTISDEERAQQEKQIKATIDRIWQALMDKDQEAFARHCDKDWRLYSGHGNKISIERLFQIHQGIPGFRIETQNFAFHVRGPVAWVTYDAFMFGTDYIFTNIFERREGQWICVHMHESGKR
jgi:hypothetical protein